MAIPAADPARRANPDAAHATDAARRELDALAREASRLRRDCSLAQADSVRSARALLDVESQLALASARIAELDALGGAGDEKILALSDRLARAERVTAAMQASLSWRITAPLRALKRKI